MPKFILEIDLGNEAMREPANIAGGLEMISISLQTRGFPTGPAQIRDINDNVVGKYEVVE